MPMTRNVVEIRRLVVVQAPSEGISIFVVDMIIVVLVLLVDLNVLARSKVVKECELSKELTEYPGMTPSFMRVLMLKVPSPLFFTS